jgi:hypothetical protein
MSNPNFVYSGATFLRFATFAELQARDSRVFEANEDLTQAEIENFLNMASQRILTQIRNSSWWREYQRKLADIIDPNLLPVVDPDYILARTQEFKDLNIYLALNEYTYPTIADFGNPDSAEIAKIKFYKDSYNVLFDEVLEAGDWYDFSENATIETADKMAAFVNRVRVR